MLGGKTYSRLMCGAAALALVAAAGAARAEDMALSIAPQPLASALKEFGVKTGRSVLYGPSLADTKVSRGVADAPDPESALVALLDGTGLSYRREGDTFLIVRADDPQSGSAAGDGAEGTVEALIVTAQKREEDIQDVPIAISAFSQETLERSQVAGGPDLMTQVPNMTFTKTNFSSYSIQIRGIGTQAISATTDPAVAVAFNNTPFVRNRFFEQEFYDLQRVEVLRGPQGTLYGRNATAGVVNVISQKPTFGYEAKLSADVANYNSTRLEGMINLPLVDDLLALRIAGAWTKRDGYSTNQITGNQIDGRDLWSTRLSLRVEPADTISANLIWEHFEEDDDRLRSGKQLCHRDARTTLGEGSDIGPLVIATGGYQGSTGAVNQGCLPASLYSPDSFQAPNGFSLPFYHPLGAVGVPTISSFDPYVSTVQSRDLRIIESTVDPRYQAETDIVELQLNFDLGESLTFTSETGYGSDTIFSTQDYNRFNTAPGAFDQAKADQTGFRPGVLQNGVFCDPQIGCADRVVAVDLSTAKSRQFSQEFRLGSDYDGPFNFSFGANFLRYDTVEKYYVFVNTLTMYSALLYNTGDLEMGPYVAGVTDNRQCMTGGLIYPDPDVPHSIVGCQYIDPNPIGSLNDQGHNYFLSKNPYKLISYAVFGEAYYNITDALKVTAGLRWTVDRKEAPRIPSWILAANSVGYPVAEVIEQEWSEPTGRLTIDWKPDFSFTDETLLYASYARGYKAGGANPPAAGVVVYSETTASSGAMIDLTASHPRTFDAEFVNAYEFGAKNTLLDGALTLNAAAFYYDYENYQISYIVNRSAVNLNFDAEVWGLEVEADWRPRENLKLGFKGGYENTKVADGERAIDVMDRTAGNPNWILVRPFPTFPSNCIVPLYTANRGDGTLQFGPDTNVNGNVGYCETAYVLGLDPGTRQPYVPNPYLIDESVNFYLPGYIGYDPTVDVGQNNGQGFFKDLSGNELPNAPHFTATITADYTVPLPNDWLATLHTDLYYQSEAWTRIFNTEGYDKLKAYSNVNLAAIFTNEEAGWKVIAYVKNVFDRDSITGAFLNSDDTGLTTNVFLTEPRLYGLRVTKEFSGGPWWTGGSTSLAGDRPLTVELAGFVQRQDAPYTPFDINHFEQFSDAIAPDTQNRDLDWGDGREVRLTWRPSGSPWQVAAGVRIGKTNSSDTKIASEQGDRGCRAGAPFFPPESCTPEYEPTYDPTGSYLRYATNWSNSTTYNREEHTFVDLEVGRDVGIGAVESTVSAGLRYADFESRTSLLMRGAPDWNLPDAMLDFKYSTHHLYSADLDSTREFKGFGPTLAWDGSAALLRSEERGELALDWSLTGGVLFGKQKTAFAGEQFEAFYQGKYPNLAQTQIGEPIVTPAPGARSKSVTVPMVDLSAGLSYEAGRVKLGAGYRWERYFDVLDVGYDEHQDGDRTIDGPYFKIAVGFGG